MITHEHYFQEKVERNKQSSSTCELRLGSDDNTLVYYADFYINYTRFGDGNKLRFCHELIINKVTGDIQVTYRLQNDRIKNGESVKSVLTVKKNNFDKLCDLVDRGFYYGEKRLNYWGVKYKRITETIFTHIKNELLSNVDDEFIKNKTYDEKTKINPLFDLIVDFHLHKKGIKFHDNVYLNIMDEYPKKKYLKLNDNKFLPAILDSYGIKSKYLVGALSSNKYGKVNFKCLSFLCKLFGDNYIEYIKRFDWWSVCSVQNTPKKTFVCKNDAEKEALTKVLEKWMVDDDRIESPFSVIQDLFTLRHYLEERGYDLKIKLRRPDDIDYLISEWSLLKKHLSLGYKLKYNIPDDVVNAIEEPIVLGDNVYIPKVILSEDDFILEGTLMKNCMSKQFFHGALYIYVALSYGRKRINLQYRRGSFVQAYGKANTPVNKEIFENAMEILCERLKEYPYLVWKKEKYEIITN